MTLREPASTFSSFLYGEFAGNLELFVNIEPLSVVRCRYRLMLDDIILTFV